MTHSHGMGVVKKKDREREKEQEREREDDEDFECSPKTDDTIPYNGTFYIFIYIRPWLFVFCFFFLVAY